MIKERSKTWILLIPIFALCIYFTMQNENENVLNNNFLMSDTNKGKSVIYEKYNTLNAINILTENQKDELCIISYLYQIHKSSNYGDLDCGTRIIRYLADINVDNPNSYKYYLLFNNLLEVEDISDITPFIDFVGKYGNYGNISELGEYLTLNEYNKQSYAYDVAKVKFQLHILLSKHALADYNYLLNVKPSDREYDEYKKLFNQEHFSEKHITNIVSKVHEYYTSKYDVFVLSKINAHLCFHLYTFLKFIYVIEEESYLKDMIDEEYELILRKHINDNLEKINAKYQN